MQRDVAAQSLQPKRAVVINVAFAEFDEASRWREAFKAFFDEGAGQGVQHQIDAFAAGRRQHRVGKAQRTRIHHRAHAERFEVSALLRAARGGIDFGAEPLCQRDGRDADTAGAGMNEHALARAQPRQMMKRVISGEIDRGDGGRLFVAEIVGHAINAVGC